MCKSFKWPNSTLYIKSRVRFPPELLMSNFDLQRSCMTSIGSDFRIDIPSINEYYEEWFTCIRITLSYIVWVFWTKDFYQSNNNNYQTFTIKYNSRSRYTNTYNIQSMLVCLLAFNAYWQLLHPCRCDKMERTRKRRRESERLNLKGSKVRILWGNVGFVPFWLRESCYHLWSVINHM